MSRSVPGREAFLVDGAELVVRKLRQLPCRKQRAAVHQQRGRHLGIAMFFCLHSEHPLRQRPLQPRAVAPEDGKPRAGKLGRALEIKNPERFAQLV